MKAGVWDVSTMGSWVSCELEIDSLFLSQIVTPSSSIIFTLTVTVTMIQTHGRGFAVI